MSLQALTEKAVAGQPIGKAEAATLLAEPLDKLCAAADTVRRQCCGNRFDLCAILNGKSGKCSENCKFCAQSAHHATCAEAYPLLPTDAIVRAAEQTAAAGVPRFSVVTSGRRLSDREVDGLCESIRAVREKIGVSVCVSVGLLPAEAFGRLRAAGASRAHCNLETSERYFPAICTTHTYRDKIAALSAARQAGLEVCSGGIMGLGETWADRIDMAIALRELGVRSVPVNFLNPIPGTPFAHNRPLTDEEKRRVIAVYRFLLPTAAIRLAGGRGLMADKGLGCFRAGANASITGDMLTTAGICAEADRAMLRSLGYEVTVDV